MTNLFQKINETWRNAKKLFFSPGQIRFEAHLAELERNVCESRRQGVTETPVAEREVIISLTSYGRRVEQVHLAIESLMRQTQLPNRIILWLDDSWKDKALPAALNLQRSRGLEVRFCQDWRSFKKLVPTLLEFPDALIITADDDIIYDSGMIDRLLRGHALFPHCVICQSAVRLKPGKPYSKAALTPDHMTPAYDLMPMGGNGTLYPPGSLHPDVTDMATAARICPTADDIWFRAMSMRTGALVVKVSTIHPTGWDFVSNEQVQDMALWVTNVRNESNDSQFDAVLKHYGLSIIP